MAMMHLPLFRGQQVFNRRSAVKLYRILAAKHGIVNLDASFWQMSCDGSPVPKPRHITPGAMLYREPFFGGGSIELKLLSDNTGITKLWINDRDVGIACLWTSVIKYHDEFKERVRSFTPSVQAFYELRHELTTISAMPTEPARIVGRLSRCHWPSRKG